MQPAGYILPHFSACWVFSCFHNPPNSDKNYMIFNVRTWSLLCVRINTGVEHTDGESVQHFCLGKSHKFACAPDGIRTSVHPNLSPMLYQLSHPVTPKITRNVGSNVDITIDTWCFTPSQPRMSTAYQGEIKCIPTTSKILILYFKIDPNRFYVEFWYLGSFTRL